MNLKKSDKMIAGIAVLVLIIAAVGIVLYSEDKDEIKPTSQSKEYAVKWMRGEGYLPVDGSVGKGGYTDPFTVTATESDSVITKVDVLITWEDNYMKGKLFNKGEDTLTAKIGLTGEEPKEHKDTGMGNETLTFPVFSKPKDMNIEDAKDLTEAEQMIREEYDNMNSASFDVDVTWKKGEKLLTLRLVKLLNFLRDKGDDFKFEITFEYYYPIVYDVNEDLPPPTEVQPARLGSMVSLGSSTKW